MDLRKGLDLSLGQKISGWARIDRRLFLRSRIPNNPPVWS